MSLVKSLVSGFVGYVEDGAHREAHLEVGQEFDADSVIVLARPELFTTRPVDEPAPARVVRPGRAGSARGPRVPDPAAPTDPTDPNGAPRVL